MSELLALQTLTFSVKPVPSRDIGAKGELVWLPLKHLYVDPIYQRAILDSGKANIRRMVEEFSWAKFGVLDVAKRSRNVYAVIDGQHRATAALCHGGIDSVPCLVLERSLAEEARAFAAINHNTTRINPLQSFRAAVAGGDLEAVGIVKACAEAGVVMAPSPKPLELLKAGETCALSAVRRCFKMHGGEVLTTALMALRAADPMVGLAGVAVRGMCELAPKHPEWHRDAASVGEALTRTGGGLAKLVNETASRRATRGGTDWKNFMELAEARIAAAARTKGVPMSRLMAGR
ncbi:MAG: ParB N-terminal domain-containing protein [Alphaproteobacteria bacterium]|nr:ParB N-terminal domain-containing protein [Alphaproteobacteria bacterium]MBL6939436.1 ParB N-terminal domain-containing protein [Alphaproteobacteria bacterium]MBL7097083.1 ParB N-terminal domain-containing protein [Alphaproteobacteria bacterium]